MEGIGIWIFLALFYLLQALTKRKQRQQREQQEKAASPKTQGVASSQKRVKMPGKASPQQSQRPISLEDLFNPNKLRDILGVPQQVEVTEQEPEFVPEIVKSGKVKMEMRKNWQDSQPAEVYFEHEQEVREPVTEIVSEDIEDITEVDETTSEFKSSRLTKSDITSDRFDERKVAPGTKKPQFALEYFDEPEDVRNAIVLKEILDKPRAYRRNIR